MFAGLNTCPPLGSSGLAGGDVPRKQSDVAPPALIRSPRKEVARSSGREPQPWHQKAAGASSREAKHVRGILKSVSDP